jgi:hypothetical protein
MFALRAAAALALCLPPQPFRAGGENKKIAFQTDGGRRCVVRETRASQQSSLSIFREVTAATAGPLELGEGSTAGLAAAAAEAVTGAAEGERVSVGEECCNG